VTLRAQSDAAAEVAERDNTIGRENCSSLGNAAAHAEMLETPAPSPTAAPPSSFTTAARMILLPDFTQAAALL
jgi:hypothetical protein